MTYSEPTEIYRYAKEHRLRRFLEFGEVRLSPASTFKNAASGRKDDEQVRKNELQNCRIVNTRTGGALNPIGPVIHRQEITTDYLILCFSRTLEKKIFADLPEADAYIVIRNVKELRERIFASTDRVLPTWAGRDASVSYEFESPHGATFVKPVKFFHQQEWRFSWMPESRIAQAQPVIISIGCIKDIAELHSQSELTETP